MTHINPADQIGVRIKYVHFHFLNKISNVLGDCTRNLKTAYIRVLCNYNILPVSIFMVKYDIKMNICSEIPNQNL